nr:potassium transporter 19-like [Tanacetum cinerariifolium]
MSTPGGSKRNSEMSTPVGSKRNSNAVYIEEEEILSGQTPDQLLPESQLPDGFMATLEHHRCTCFRYVMIVLRANDNGEGGTFALYSKLCRYAKVGLIHSEQPEDREVSNFKLELPGKRNTVGSTVKKNLERRGFAKIALLFAAMLGTSVVIGDGILTPSIA